MFFHVLHAHHVMSQHSVLYAYEKQMLECRCEGGGTGRLLKIFKKDDDLRFLKLQQQRFWKAEET